MTIVQFLAFLTKIYYDGFASGLGQRDEALNKFNNANMQKKNKNNFFRVNIVTMFNYNVSYFINVEDA